MMFSLSQLDYPDEPPLWLEMIAVWFPSLMVGTLAGLAIWLVITYAQRSSKKQETMINELNDRSFAHMDRIEVKTDRMIQLLEEIRDGQSRHGD